MPDRVDDDLLGRDFVEDKKGIGRRRQAPNRWIFRPNANVGMRQKQVDDMLNSSLNALRTLR